MIPTQLQHKMGFCDLLGIRMEEEEPHIHQDLRLNNLELASSSIDKTSCTTKSQTLLDQFPLELVH